MSGHMAARRMTLVTAALSVDERAKGDSPRDAEDGARRGW
jgi:hypothetical protein